MNQVRNASGGRFGNRRIAACAPLRPTAIATRVRSNPDNTLGFGVRFLSRSRFGNACPLHEVSRGTALVLAILMTAGISAPSRATGAAYDHSSIAGSITACIATSDEMKPISGAIVTAEARANPWPIAQVGRSYFHLLISDSQGRIIVPSTLTRLATRELVFNVWAPGFEYRRLIIISDTTITLASTASSDSAVPASWNLFAMGWGSNPFLTSAARYSRDDVLTAFSVLRQSLALIPRQPGELNSNNRPQRLYLKAQQRIGRLDALQSGILSR